MAVSSLSRKNIQFFVTIVCGVHFLFVAVTHYHSAADKYEYSQPFKNGMTADAKITDVPDRASEGVSLIYTDYIGEVHHARVIVDYPEYLRVGQTVQISYVPESPDWVRAPSLGWSAAEYSGFRGMTIIWVIGALCIFPLAFWRRFRIPEYKPELEIAESATATRFGKSYIQLFILWSLYAFALFVLYAIVTLTITHILMLSVWLENTLLFAFHMLLFLGIGMPALRVLINDPLTISRRGISFFGKRPVPWADMSQIRFIRMGRVMEERLIISLNESSTIKGVRVYQLPLREMGRVVYLNLYGTRFELDDVIRSINHFGLEARDPDAAQRLLDTFSDTGIINSTERVAVDPPIKPKPDGEYYMSGGFHLGN